MKKFIRKIKLNRNYFLLGLLILAVVVIMLPQTVNAEDSSTLSTIGNVAWNTVKAIVNAPILIAVGTIAVLITVLFGSLNTIIIGALVNLTKYNNFINEPSITAAWVVVRDLCNMFFILILLVIAFATILRLPNYEWKKLLPKLLIMAVLINFSKTICGLIIDFSQVIMMTFVNAWGGAGNFVSMLNMAKFFAGVTTKGFTSPDWSVLNVVAGMLIGIMFLVISGIVLLVALAVFLMRVIMLWIYIVLSPLAFLAAAFPAGQKYATQWWTEFTKYIINGPVLAFFIWLALITSKQITDSESLVFNNPANTDQCFSIIQGMCMNNFMPFILSIGMLLGGLMITQQIGGVGSGMAAKGLDWAKKVGGAPLAAGAWAGKGLFFKAGRMADTGQMWLQKKAGLEFPKSLNYRMIAAGWKSDQAKKMADYESGVLTKTGPLHTMWQETFNKHLRVKQYGTVRKSRKERAAEAKEKQGLEFENDILNGRINFSQMGFADKAVEQNKWFNQGGRQAKKNKYVEKGYGEEKAEEEVKKDEAILGGAAYNINAAEEKIAVNKKMVEEYEDPRKKWAREKWLLSKEKAVPYDFVLSKAGDKEREDKEKRAMEARTQERSFAVTNELIKAFNEGEDDKLVSAFKILIQNNDMNDGLKDKRVIDIMTRQNGILQKMAEKGQLGDLGKGEEFNNNLKVLQKDFAANPVTPAHAQAMVRGMLGAIGVSEKKAARTSNDIGELSFTAGSGLLFGSALGNADTGEFEFEKLKFDKEKRTLQTSTARKAAISGKYNTAGTQEKMKKLHPDMIIAEDPDGGGSRLTEDGEYYLINSLTGNDLTQVNRMRPDTFKKIANSPKVLQGIKKLVDKLEEQGNIEQAKNIKYFTGYIIAKTKGKMLASEADYLKTYKDDVES